MELAGRRVLITGASRGIGQALAERFAAAGARVALVARSEGALKELADRLGGTAHPADLSDSEQLTTLIERVEGDGGPIDVLVNNAGVDNVGFFTHASSADVEGLYRLNVIAPVELTRQLLPRMLDRGQGHIVMMSSMAGVLAAPGYALYASSKAALNQFTASVRLELKDTPVNTTLVEVAYIVDTEMADSVRSTPGVGKASERFYKLHALVDTPMERLTGHVVNAVRKEKRHVRLPRRMVPYAVLAEAPRLSVEAVLTGAHWREHIDGPRPS